MDNLIKQNKIVLNFKKKKFAKGLDRTVLTGSCGPTPVLAVHRIHKKSSFLGLKTSFHGPTSRSSPVLKTMLPISLLTNGFSNQLVPPFINSLIDSRSVVLLPTFKSKCQQQKPIARSKLPGQEGAKKRELLCNLSKTRRVKLDFEKEAPYILILAKAPQCPFVSAFRS